MAEPRLPQPTCGQPGTSAVLQGPPGTTARISPNHRPVPGLLLTQLPPTPGVRALQGKGTTPVGVLLTPVSSRRGTRDQEAPHTWVWLSQVPRAGTAHSCASSLIPVEARGAWTWRPEALTWSWSISGALHTGTLAVRPCHGRQVAVCRADLSDVPWSQRPGHRSAPSPAPWSHN